MPHALARSHEGRSPNLMEGSVNRAETTYRDAPALAPTVLISRLDRVQPRERALPMSESDRSPCGTHPDLPSSATNG
jgi:hypothetical protein